VKAHFLSPNSAQEDTLKIAVISDLHLGPGLMNRCSPDARKITRWLDLIEATHDRVIIAGDLFDLSRPRRFSGWEEHLDAIHFQWGELSRRLEAMEAVYGNHDRERALMGVPEQIIIPTESKPIIILHGHQFDPLIKQIPGLEKSANFAAGWFVRLGLSPLAEAMGTAVALNERVESQFRRVDADDRDLSRQGAHRKLREGFSMVILGHSHRLRHIALPEGDFVNSGSWVCGHADWASIDTDTKQVRLFRDGAHIPA